MGIGYQGTDRDVIDYDLWFHEDDLHMALRGPRGDLEAAGAICCIGAAQTFGRFVERPFAQQIGDILNRRVLNLGFSGAGPEFYLKRPVLMNCLEQADMVVVQSMSARSVTAGLFETQSNNGVSKFLSGPRAGETHLAQKAYGLLRKEYGEDAFRAQVSAAQDGWLARHRELAERISGRKIFLWLSSEKPGDNVDLSQSPVGIFPHFVDADMVQAVADMGFEVVECVLKDMPAQVLVNDRTGHVEEAFDAEHFPHRPDRLRALNTYYATPELHNLAARLLIRQILSA
jgi:hypothetical protein